MLQEYKSEEEESQQKLTRFWGEFTEVSSQLEAAFGRDATRLAGQVMAVDIRKPKPFHSAREFFGEMLSVIAGILIALSLEALIDQYRTDRLIDYARDDFRFELQGNRDKLTEDLQKAKETEASLRTLVDAGRILLKHQPLPATMNLNLSRSFVVLRSAAWTSALSTQVMGHFPPREARALAAAYSEQEAFSIAEQAAQQQWFSLSGYVEEGKDLTDDQLRQGLHEAAEGFAYLQTLEASESRLLATYDETLKALKR